MDKNIKMACFTAVAITGMASLAYLTKVEKKIVNSPLILIGARVGNLLDTIQISETSKDVLCDIKITDGDAGYYCLKKNTNYPTPISESGFYDVHISMKKCSGLPDVQMGESTLYNVILINDEIAFAPTKIGLQPQINHHHVYLNNGDMLAFATGILIQTREWNNTTVKYQDLSMESYKQKQRINPAVYKDVQFDLCVDVYKSV
jgi:hypothetical protein